MGWKSEHNCCHQNFITAYHSSGQTPNFLHSYIHSPIQNRCLIFFLFFFCIVGVFFFFFWSEYCRSLWILTIHVFCQLVDMQVFAAPRITLKSLVPTFPCFASIVVSLMEKVSENIFKPLPVFLWFFKCLMSE